MEITVFMAFGEQTFILGIAANAILLLGALRIWHVMRRPPRD